MILSMERKRIGDFDAHLIKDDIPLLIENGPGEGYSAHGGGSGSSLDLLSMNDGQPPFSAAEASQSP